MSELRPREEKGAGTCPSQTRETGRDEEVMEQRDQRDKKREGGRTLWTSLPAGKVFWAPPGDTPEVKQLSRRHQGRRDHENFVLTGDRRHLEAVDSRAPTKERDHPRYWRQEGTESQRCKYSGPERRGQPRTWGPTTPAPGLPHPQNGRLRGGEGIKMSPLSSRETKLYPPKEVTRTTAAEVASENAHPCTGSSEVYSHTAGAVQDFLSWD